MRNTIIVASKAMPHKLPPVISLLAALGKLYDNIVYITAYCDANIKKILKKHNNINIVELYDYMPESHKISERLKLWRDFRKECIKYFEKEKRAHIWITGGDSALAIGRYLLKKKFVLQLNEMYDSRFCYNKLLMFFSRKALLVVVPEYCRANIIRTWFKLNYTPRVLPNKSILHPRKKHIQITDPMLSQKMKLLRDKKIVLQQGWTGYSRDISCLADALNELGGPWRLLTMGHITPEYFNNLKCKFPATEHIPFISFPQYFEITSYAYLGATVYDHSCLNNIFCAPNKIWEYTGFGIPILCADIPGLRYAIDINKAGIAVDFNSKQEIIAALLEMDSNYDQFNTYATRFFDSYDYVKNVDVITEAFHNVKKD